MNADRLYVGPFSIRKLETENSGHGWFTLDTERSHLLSNIGFKSAVIIGAIFTDLATPITCKCCLDHNIESGMEISGLIVSPEEGAPLIPKPVHCRRIAQISYDKGHMLTHIQNSRYEPVTQADVVVLHEDGRVIAYWLKEVIKAKKVATLPKRRTRKKK